MTPTLRLCLALVVLPLLAACAADADEPAGPQRTDSAGVEIVSNPGTDRPLGWQFREVARIGGADGGPEAFYQVYQASVAAGPDGTIYVMDAGNRQLRAFDDRGRHLWSAGREGEGPGEFRFPLSLWTGPEGTVTVLDAGRRAFIRYSPGGEFLDEEPQEGDLFGTAAAIPLEGVRLLSRRERLTDQGVERRTLTRIQGSDTTALGRVEMPLEEAVQVNACGRPLYMQMGGFFAPPFQWTAREDRVAVAWGWAEYRVNMHRAGEMVQSVRRAGERPPVDREAIRADHPDGFSISVGGGEPCELDLDELMEKRGHGDVIPAVADLALSPGGELWVERQVTGTDHPIDLFDADGAYLGTLPAGTPFPAAFLHDGRVVTVETNEVDIPMVVVYRIERGGEEAPGG